MEELQNIIIYRTADRHACIGGTLCQGWKDLAEPAADGRTFCHLEAEHQHSEYKHAERESRR